MFDFDTFARASRQATEQFKAQVGQCNENPNLLPAGRVAKRAELRAAYNQTVTNIQANCQAEIDRSYAKVSERDGYMTAREARSERELLGKLPASYVSILQAELSGLSAPELVARLKGARDDSEKLAISKLGSATLRTRPANPNGANLVDVRATADFERLTTPARSPEWLAIAADVSDLRMVSNRVRELDALGYEENIRQRFGLPEPREMHEPDPTAVFVSGFQERKSA